jgi:hypothetical protein
MKAYAGSRTDEELLADMASSDPEVVQRAMCELAEWLEANRTGGGPPAYAPPQAFLRRVRLAKLVLKKKAWAPALPHVAKLAVPELAYWWKWDELAPFAKLVAAFGEDEALTIALGSNAGPTSTEGRKAAERVLMCWFEEHPAEAVARATRIADLMLTEVHALARGRGAGIVVLPRIADAHPELPTKYDDLVRIDHERRETEALRHVLAKIPAERRAAIFARPYGSGTRAYVLEDLRDHVPEVALRRLEEAKALEERPREPPPPRAPGPYSFVEMQIVLPSDYRTLDAVGQSQYRQAAGAYAGDGSRPVEDPHDFIALLKTEGLCEGDAELRRWKILREGAHVFDLWVVWVENGTFFLAGKEEPAGVQVIQGKYEAYGGAPAKLAEELAASEPQRGLWTT